MNTHWYQWLKQFTIYTLCVTLLMPVTAMANTPGTITTLSVRDLTDGITPLILAETILGSGVQARKVGGGAIDTSIFKGSQVSAGAFSGGLGSIGIKDGIVLSTGKVKDVIGPNDSTARTTQLGISGDADLAKLIDTPLNNTYDATSVEFEFKLPNPTVDKVLFKFVLASEEYPEYISSFHDVIGLFINDTNVALVPNSNPPKEVSIGSINNLQNSTLFKDNQSLTNPPFNTQMDGFTTVLTASANVTPNSWNKIKLAIADVGDDTYDSNIFIEAKSLSSPGGLAASNITGSGFTLTWSPIANVTGYDVFFQRTVGGVIEEQFVASATTPSYTFTGLQEYKDYYVAVKSRDTNGIQSPASPALLVKTKDVTASTPPTNLTAVNIEAESVDLVWTPSSDVGTGVKKYFIYVNNEKTAESTAPSFTVNSLTQSSNYVIGVAAVDGDGNISDKTNINVTTLDGIAPSAPLINPKPPRIITPNSVSITWDAAVDNPGGSGIAGYLVYKDFKNTPLASLTPVCETKFRACEVSGLTTDREYTIGVVAVDNAGNESEITEGSTVVVKTLDGNNADKIPPSVPGAASVSSATATNFNVTWGFSTDTGGSGIAGYEVYINNVIYGTVASTLRSLKVEGLEPVMTYQVKIRAVDNAGNKSEFREVTGTTTKDLQPPTIPTGLGAINKTDNSFTLTWNPSVDNIEMHGYEIFRDGVLIGTSELQSFDVTGLSAGKTYKMTVKSVDKADNRSAASATLTVKINTDNSPPTKPFGLEAIDVQSTSFDMSWDPSTDNVGVTGYDIYNGDEKIGSSVTESFAVTGLTKATTYFFTVRAKDAVGNVSESSDVLEVTTVENSEPPLPPDSLYAEAITDTNFVLIWDRSEDDVAVAYYDIYYEVVGADGVTVIQPRAKIKSVNEPTSATAVTAQTIIGTGEGLDIPLTTGFTYNMSIKAFDSDGNESLDFSDVLPVLVVNSNNGPIVTVTPSKSDLTRVGVSLRYRIGNKLITDDPEAPGYLTNANVSCFLRNSNGVRVLNLYPRTSNPKTSFKKMLRVGRNSCLLNVSENKYKDGTYYAYLVVEDPTNPDLRTLIIRTMKVDKTAPVISNVTKSNDIYAPDGSLSTNINLTINESSRVSIKIVNSNGRPVRTLSRKTSLLAGTYTFQWNGKDSRNREVPDGLYKVSIFAINKVKLSSENIIASKPTANPPIQGNTLSIYVESKAPTFSRVRALPSTIKRTNARAFSKIEYSISEKAYMTIKVYDKTDQLVRTIQESKLATNEDNNFTWDGRDGSGVDLPDGKYTIRMDAVDLPPTPDKIKSIVKDGEVDEPSITPKASETYSLTVNLDGKNSPTFETMTPAENDTVNLLADGVNTIDLTYSFSEQVDVFINVTNSLDKVVRVIKRGVTVDANQVYTATWNGSTGAGAIVKSGTYTVSVRAVDSLKNEVVKQFTVNVTLP